MNELKEKYGKLYFEAKEMLSKLSEKEVRKYFKDHYGSDYHIDEVLKGYLRNKGN
jgi:chemotaxis methyl-accepting protein methylase